MVGAASGAPDSLIQVEPAWWELLARLEEGRPWRSIFVLGRVDTGKTTLCRFLGRALAQRYRTAAIDCDPGQSALGPPTTLGLAWEPWEGARPLALRFVGATSPVGHFMPMLTGAKRLAERALAYGAQKIVFDSSGYMDSDVGREFHFQMIDLLDPDHLVVLQRSGEIEPLLANFARRFRPRIHRLPVSGAVLARERPTRRAYRQAQFQHYFAAAALRTLALDGLGFHGMVPPPELAPRCRGRLIALCDRHGFAAVLGIVEELDLDRGLVRLYAPPFERRRIASVQFGSICLEPAGREC